MSVGLSGFRAWILQRVTAVLLALGFLAMIVVLWLNHWTYADWAGFVRSPLVAVAILLGYAAALLHAWIGIRDVVVDYLHPLGLRLIALTVVGMILIGLALWAGTILLPGVVA